jgi:hypothetical protein
MMKRRNLFGALIGAIASSQAVNAGQPVENHFVDVTDMVEIGSGAEREVGKMIFFGEKTALRWDGERWRSMYLTNRRVWRACKINLADPL